MTNAICPVTRDHPEYWKLSPADHSERGFFVGGPDDGTPPIKQAAHLVVTVAPEKAEGPEGAHQRMAREKSKKMQMIANQQRFLAAVAGNRVRASKRAA